MLNSVQSAGTEKFFIAIGRYIRTSNGVEASTIFPVGQTKINTINDNNYDYYMNYVFGPKIYFESKADGFLGSEGGDWWSYIKDFLKKMFLKG